MRPALGLPGNGAGSRTGAMAMIPALAHWRCSLWHKTVDAPIPRGKLRNVWQLTDPALWAPEYNNPAQRSNMGPGNDYVCRPSVAIAIADGNHLFDFGKKGVHDFGVETFTSLRSDNLQAFLQTECFFVGPRAGQRIKNVSH